MKPRAAFMADSWSDGARIFQILEGRLGRTVQTKYGRFPTWTEANFLAMQLNNELGVGPIEARELSSSAMMCNSLHALACANLALSVSPSRFAANAVKVQTLIARLTLALTFCQLMDGFPAETRDKLLRHAQKALDDVRSRLYHITASFIELEELLAKLELLETALRNHGSV